MKEKAMLLLEWFPISIHAILYEKSCQASNALQTPTSF